MISGSPLTTVFSVAEEPRQIAPEAGTVVMATVGAARVIPLKLTTPVFVIPIAVNNFEPILAATPFIHGNDTYLPTAILASLPVTSPAR